MRRFAILCVLCLSASAALVWGSALAKPKPATNTTKMATAGSDPVLFGDQTVESTQDSNPAGVAQAWPFTNSRSGTTASISIYVDSANAATTLMVGLYASNNGSPGPLLASGSLAYPTSGAWNTISIGSAAVSSGKTYWVALLGAGGTPHFRDRGNALCNSQGSAQSNLSSLPSTWSTGPVWGSCPGSAYVNGYLTTTSAPVDSALPTISGTAAQGQTLSTSNGSWSNSPTSYGYQWQDCNSSGGNCANVSGATSGRYALTSGDVGHTVRAVVTASNAGGSASSSSAQSAMVSAPAPGAPVNTGLPTVSGSATQGQTLSTSTGSWSNSPTSYGYQWQDCNSSGASCTNINAATSSSYTLGSGDVGHTIRATLTATNNGGSASATTAQTSTVSASAPPPPSNTALPVVSGTATAGQTLSTTNGSWIGSPSSYGYEWQDCSSSGSSCTNVSGATSSSYTLASGDVGHTIRAVVTAINAGGSTPATSAGVGPVIAQGSGPCNLTYAAGADPNTSCWATHTGVLNGTGYTEAQIEAGAPGFTHTTGDLVITQPNTIIDHAWISGCIQIADGADNVTIKNSLVTSNGNACAADNSGGSAINTGQGPNIAKNTLIEDTTVDGGVPSYGSNNAGITVDAGEVLRVNAFGFTRTFLSDSNTAQYPALFQDDYAHGFGGCVHDDGTWFDSSSYVTFNHSYVLMGDPSGSGCTTAALSGGADYGPQDHVTYSNSYANGADGEAVHTGCGSTYMTITNNAIDNGTYKDASDGGYQALTGNAWSGNYSVDYNTGANLGSWGPFSASC
jgi:hypothetical protein